MTTSVPSTSGEDGRHAALRHLRAARKACPADPGLWGSCALEAARAGAVQISERACRELQGRAAGVPGGQAALLSLLAASGLQSARNHEWGRAARWRVLIERYGGALGLQLPEAQFLIGLLRAQAGEHQRALAAVVAAVAGRRVSLERCLAWSNELRYHHQFALAACLLEQAIADHGDRTSLLVREAAVLAELGQLGQARRRWSMALAREPAHPDARLLFATSGGHQPPAPPSPDRYDLPAGASAEAVTRALQLCGVAIVRGALDPGLAGRWCQRLVDNLEVVHDPLFPDRRNQEADVPAHFLAASSQRRRLEELCQGMRDQPMAAWHGTLDGQIDIDDVWLPLMDLAAVTGGARGYLGEDFRAPRQLGHARRVPGQQDGGLPLRQDARGGHWDHPGLSLWVPLSACGVDAPSLEVVPYRLDHLFPCSSSVPEGLVPPGFIRTLVLAPGDVVLFTSMVLHRTQPLHRADGLRLSFDLRFESCREWLP